MNGLEQIVIQLLLNFVTVDQLNGFLGDPRSVAVLLGALVALSGAWLGTFLLLRKMSLTSDAISHTVLLGIVIAFLLMVGVFGLEADLSSPWLILGATAAGVLTVLLTEAVQRSGLVKADTALGLVFPLLFAIAIILVSRYIQNVHLDTDAVLVGEIGVAWANTNSHCLEYCEEVVITPDDPRAEVGQRCTNCSRESGISPRSPEAVFEQICTNCGTYTAAQAWGERLIPDAPVLVFFPRSLSVMGVITLLNGLFVLLFYKELKLSTFDQALAKSLGFRPGLLTYALMVLVSLTAVGAFDAVGAVMVVAFFIIPAAAAYLLTDRLWTMLLIGPAISILAAVTGYDLARGLFLGVFPVNGLLQWLDGVIGLGGYTEWNTSISASMVMMLFLFFLLAWVASPRYGLVSTLVRRYLQQLSFAEQLLLGHLRHHHREADLSECRAVTLHEHLRWSPRRVQWVLRRLWARGLVRVEEDVVYLTTKGAARVDSFVQVNLPLRPVSAD